MKKYFKYTFIIFLIVLFIVPVNFLLAQSTTTSPPAVSTAVKAGLETILPGSGLLLSIVDGNTLIKLLLAPIAFIILKVTSWIMWLSGNLLDYVIQFTIVDMSSYINGGSTLFDDDVGPLTGINTTWKVIRDLMNIAFIFILVFEGIRLILGLEGAAGRVQKFIVGLVLASILINFSLFFSKIMIDASNIVTVGFYQAVVEGGDPPSLSTPFTRYLGLSNYYSVDSLNSIKGDAEKRQDGYNQLILYTAGSVLFLVLSFVFFAMAILFGIRFLTLLILLVLSPVAYMGIALPWAKGPAKQWWSAFNSQLLFAPVFMLMMWIVLSILGGIAQGWGRQILWAEALLGNGSTAPNIGGFGIIFNFMIIIGLAIASLIISKNLAAKGHSLIASATNKATAFAGGAVFGGAAVALRNSVGAKAHEIANDENLKAKAATGDKAARLKLAAAQRVASSSFDVRATSIGKGSLAGVDVGKAKTGGYTKKTEDYTKKQDEYAKSLKPSVAATEEAKNQLNNPAFIATEKAEKARYEASYEYKTKQEAVKNSVTEEETRLKTAQVGLKTAQADSDRIKSQVDVEEAKIKGLLQQISDAKNDTVRTLAQQDLEKVRQAKRPLDEALKNAKELSKEKEKIVEESESKITDIQNKAEAERENWMSQTKKKVMAMSGGQKEEKYEKGHKLEGQIKQQAVTSEADERVTAYADRLDTKASNVEKYSNVHLFRYTNKIWHGNPILNKSASAKVRASVKKKTAKELVDDLLKETGEKTTEETTTPPPVTPPPPPPPISGTGSTTT